MTLAQDTAARIGRIAGLSVVDRDAMLDGAMLDRDETKLVVDVTGLGLTGYAADEWLQRERRVSAVLSDMRHLAAVIGVGTTVEQLDRLVSALGDLAAARPSGERSVPLTPGYDTLTLESVMPAHEAFGGATEIVPWSDVVGRIAAEILAPTPPAVPRALPSHRLTRPLMDRLTAQADAGAYVADKGTTGERGVRVVR